MLDLQDLQDLQDRRAALKARHRQAILTAARELLEERGAGGLSADELADRADVARRTLFNHFSSLEQIVVTCLETELRAAIMSVETAVRSGEAADGPLDDLGASLAGADLPAAIARIARIARVDDGPSSADHRLRLQQQAVRHVADPMARQLRDRHPELGELDAVLLTTTVLNGVSVLAATWLEQTGGALDTAARRRWDELLDHLFATLRHGFAPATEGA